MRAVTVLEAERRHLGKRAVDRGEGGLRLGKRLKRGMGFPGLHVVQGQVTLAEGAPLGILAGETDRGPFGEDCGEGQRLGVRPVDLALHRVSPTLELSAQAGVDLEPIRHLQERLIQFFEPLRGDGGSVIWRGRLGIDGRVGAAASP